MNAPPVSKAAQVKPPHTQPTTKKGREAKQESREPLQVRWPAKEVKAARLAAIQLDFPTLSDFMLACFHAYMKSRKHS
jgi:hypothetical protein